MDRSNPAYLARVLDQKSQQDAKELEIREKTRAVIMQEPWVIDAIAKVRTLQIDSLREAIKYVNDARRVHDVMQDVLATIAMIFRSKIVEGAEFLERIPPSTPVLIATNHFGAYKLFGIDPRKEISVDIPGYDAMYPFPMYFAALHPVAEALGDNLYYASNDFPGILGTIHSKAGFIHVPAIEGGKTEALIGQTKDALGVHRNAAIVNFPEGTTSGKPTGLGSYDLNPFKTGGYVIAATLGLHIVPVAQYFDPHEGFQLKVFEPFVPERAERAVYESYAASNRSHMQAWFDQRLKR